MNTQTYYSITVVSTIYTSIITMIFYYGNLFTIHYYCRYYL